MGGERRIGVAIDFSDGSRKALKWAVENVVRNGDHLILITIRPEVVCEGGERQLWEATGSPLIPLVQFSDPAIMKKYDVKPDPATLDIASTAARQKEVDVLMKVYWGDPGEKLCEAVGSIPLTCLVVGNRGLGMLKRVVMGSVSNHIVHNAACPVTVVKH
uniref:UspA domain-containing protein n=1 Tax=Kalanchoe fedtschenkoi TaxID=63787 RepID=A0A7N0UBS8_KALFE